MFYDVKIVCNQVSSVHKSTFWNTATCFNLQAGCGCFALEAQFRSCDGTRGLQILKYVWTDLL